MKRAYRWAMKVKPRSDGPDHVPIGSMIQFIGDVLPEGYLWGEGQTLSCYDYPELYAVLKRPLPSWRHPVVRLREMMLRAQHKFYIPDMRGSATVYREPPTTVYREP